MFIPGVFISILTFPGVVIHELSHQLCCRYFKIPVYQVCYFRFGNPAGYVIHGQPQNWVQHVLISTSPFFLNSLLAALISFPSVFRVFEFENSASFLDCILIWLGVSIAMHAIPSTGDANSMLTALSDKKVPIFAKFCIFPLAGLIYILAVGSVVWLDLFYGVTASLALPQILLRYLT